MGILLASEHQKSTFHLIFQSSDKKITHNTLIINVLYTPPINRVSLLLPDRDFFLLMFVRKEATAADHIEGTQADIVDAIEAEVASFKILDSDAEDILYYIHALNFGLERAKKVPISNRLIKEMHQKLTQGARATQNPYPGEFRYTQKLIALRNQDCNYVYYT